MGSWRAYGNDIVPRVADQLAGGGRGAPPRRTGRRVRGEEGDVVEGGQGGLARVGRVPAGARGAALVGPESGEAVAGRFSDDGCA